MKATLLQYNTGIIHAQVVTIQVQLGNILVLYTVHGNMATRSINCYNDINFIFIIPQNSISVTTARS